MVGYQQIHSFSNNFSDLPCTNLCIAIFNMPGVLTRNTKFTLNFFKAVHTTYYHLKGKCCLKTIFTIGQTTSQICIVFNKIFSNTFEFVT